MIRFEFVFKGGKREKKPTFVLCFFLSCSVSHKLTFFHSEFPDLQLKRLAGLTLLNICGSLLELSARLLVLGLFGSWLS